MNSKHRILLVEDDRIIKDAYALMLQNSGFLVETATDGIEALEKVSSFMPDLILLDVFLPKMSGFDVIEKLKQDSVLSKIPLIVLTNVNIDREDMLKKGVERCFIKSEITPRVLVDKVNETLRKPI